MTYIAKNKVLTYFIQYDGQFEIQILDIYVNLKKSYHDCFQYDLYILQVSVFINFGYIYIYLLSAFL